MRRNHNYRPSCVCSSCAEVRHALIAQEYIDDLSAWITRALRPLNLHLWAGKLNAGLLIAREEWIRAGCTKPLHRVPDLVIGATR